MTVTVFVYLISIDFYNFILFHLVFKSFDGEVKQSLKTDRWHFQTRGIS